MPPLRFVPVASCLRIHAVAAHYHQSRSAAQSDCQSPWKRLKRETTHDVRHSSGLASLGNVVKLLDVPYFG